MLSAFPKALADALETPFIPEDYTAVYQVLRNGKNLAEITIGLSHQDDIWTLHGFTHDTQGLADLLNVKGAQTTTGRWQDGRFIPGDHKFSFSLVGYKTAWHADFDWPSGIVTTTSKAGASQLPLARGAVDPFSLSLNIRTQLANSQPHMAVKVVEKDKIEDHVYQADHEESVDTALGCLKTTAVKRIRKSSKRTSLVWFANDHNYVPVLMEHSKKNGKGFRLQIIALDVGGQLIQPVGPCGEDTRRIRAPS